MEKEYLQIFLDNESKILSSLIKKILNAQNKGDYYYYYEDLILLINKVIQTVETLNIDLPFNYFFNYLVVYEDRLNLENSFIDYYCYRQIYKNKYMQAIKEKDDIKFISFLINNDGIENKDKKNIYEFYIKEALYNNLELNFETFKNLIISYVKKQISFSKKTTVTIGNKEYISKNKIILNNELIKKLYHEGNYEALLRIYYSINQVQLFDTSKIKLNNINNLSTLIKEYILVNYLPNYFENNKEHISYILNNEIYALYELTNLFTKFNIKYNKDYYQKLIHEKEKLLKKEYRIYNNKKTKVDKLFDNFIMTNTTLINDYISID